MIAALKGYRMKLLMPDNMSQERRAAMRAYGAELILVTKEQGMEGARDLALAMSERGEGKLLDQFNNPDNPYAHYTTTGPKSGGKRQVASPILSPAWARPAPLPACRVFCASRKSRSPSLACSRKRAAVFGHSPLACGIYAGHF